MTGRLGIHGLVFGDDWSTAAASTACAAAAQIGYELFELLIFDPMSLDLPTTQQAVSGAGLELRLGMALGADADISSMDQDIARRGEKTVARCLEIAAELGAPAVSGITYAAFNNYSTPPSPSQRRQVIEALGRLDRRAGKLGVRLGIEPVNRYESYMVNTIDQAGDLIRAVGGSNLFIHLDTFHMSIEEADIGAALRRNAGHLGYVHLAESHRGQLGTGNFDFRSFFRALINAGYTGDYVVESFSPSVLSPGVAGAVSLWRCQWSDAATTARLAKDFVTSELRLASMVAQR